MDQLKFKKKVLEKAIERQQELIDDFKTRIKEMRSGEINSSGGQFDHNQQSLQVADNEVIEELAEELDFAQDELKLLNAMEVGDQPKDKAVMGALVKTDKMTFFPSVSIEEFEVDGNKIFGISAKAPLFKEMLGKSKGDSFSFNNVSYLIKEIF